MQFKGGAKFHPEQAAELGGYLLNGSDFQVMKDKGVEGL